MLLNTIDTLEDFSPEQIQRFEQYSYEVRHNHSRAIRPKPGYIYALTNPGHPGMLKIGKTTRTPEQRAAELANAGVPFCFDIAFAAPVMEADRAEKIVHLALSEYRVRKEREWFETTLDVARPVMELAADLVDTLFVPGQNDPDRRAVCEYRARFPMLRFRRWLGQQIDRRDLIGEFARAAFWNPALPWGAEHLDELLEQQQELLELGAIAWREFGRTSH